MDGKNESSPNGGAKETVEYKSWWFGRNKSGVIEFGFRDIGIAKFIGKMVLYACLAHSFIDGNGAAQSILSALLNIG